MACDCKLSFNDSGGSDRHHTGNDLLKFSRHDSVAPQKLADNPAVSARSFWNCFDPLKSPPYT